MVIEAMVVLVVVAVEAVIVVVVLVLDYLFSSTLCREGSCGKASLPPPELLPALMGLLLSVTAGCSLLESPWNPSYMKSFSTSGGDKIEIKRLSVCVHWELDGGTEDGDLGGLVESLTHRREYCI